MTPSDSGLTGAGEVAAEWDTGGRAATMEETGRWAKSLSQIYAGDFSLPTQPGQPGWPERDYPCAGLDGPAPKRMVEPRAVAPVQLRRSVLLAVAAAGGPGWTCAQNLWHRGTFGLRFCREAPVAPAGWSTPALSGFSSLVAQVLAV